MQTIYVGNTLINDIALGKSQIQQIWAQPPVISTLNLQYWFDTSFSASSVNWRANVGNGTGSLGNATFNSDYPPRYTLTGAGNSEILFSGGNPGVGTAARTTSVTFNTTSVGSVQNIVWFGNPTTSQLLALQISTGSLGADAYLKVQYIDSQNNIATSSIATELGTISPNKWYMATLQTSGSTFQGITVWLNNKSQTFTGTNSWTTADVYWINGAANGANGYPGSIQANLYYNSYISQSAVLQNYEYYKLKLAL
jgi:hypothetical protein